VTTEVQSQGLLYILLWVRDLWDNDVQSQGLKWPFSLNFSIFKIDYDYPLSLTEADVVGDGIKPQVHGLTEVVIKEYRFDMELWIQLTFNND